VLERVLGCVLRDGAKVCIDLSCISSTVWIRLYFNEDFNFGNKNSPQGPNLESRAAGGQQSTHASLTNSQPNSESWAGVLSWCSNQVLCVHASGLFVPTASLKHFRKFRWNCILTVSPRETNSTKDTITIKSYQHYLHIWANLTCFLSIVTIFHPLRRLHFCFIIVAIFSSFVTC
jgi:hypothetical protein